MSVLVPGVAVALKDSAGVGNTPREFCFVVPASAQNIQLSLNGGNCTPYTCPGDDVELYLKAGSAPDPFTPDAATKQWVFTPGHTGVKGTTATAGVWFLSQISSAYTLGYRDVSMTLSYP